MTSVGRNSGFLDGCRVPDSLGSVEICVFGKVETVVGRIVATSAMVVRRDVVGRCVVVCLESGRRVYLRGGILDGGEGLSCEFVCGGLVLEGYRKGGSGLGGCGEGVVVDGRKGRWEGRG